MTRVNICMYVCMSVWTEHPNVRYDVATDRRPFENLLQLATGLLGDRLLHGAAEQLLVAAMGAAHRDHPVSASSVQIPRLFL